MEQRLLAQLSPQAKSADTWDCQYRVWGDIDAGYHLDHQLVRYTLSSRVASEDKVNFILATDAHDGCGIKVHNTVIGIDNLVILAAPQAFQGEWA